MELNADWKWFIELIEGKVRWQHTEHKDVFSADLRVVLQRDEMILDFLNAEGTSMNYKGPGVASLFEKLSQSRKADK